jgi:hypothetical protein
MVKINIIQPKITGKTDSFFYEGGIKMQQYKLKYYDRMNVTSNAKIKHIPQDELIKFLGINKGEFVDYDGYYKDSTTEYEWRKLK